MTTMTGTPLATTTLLVAYLLFGLVHEATHWLCAFLLGVLDAPRIAKVAQSPTRLLFLLGQALFGRQANIQECMLLPSTCTKNEENLVLVQHAGWIVSCSLAVLLSLSMDAQKPHRKVWLLAAYATAVEAIVTDLLQFTPTNNPTVAGIFYCGNFGLILLNPMWLQATEERGNCNSALKILQDMIRVTMMRGAQAGGVVTFEPQPGGHMKAIRSRVVNRKRTDLSEGIIKKVKADNRKNFEKSASTSTAPNAMTFSGHTRFATSSIADFGGTHPHQWSPRAMRRVLNFQTASTSLIGVENYIMHNGT